MCGGQVTATMAGDFAADAWVEGARPVMGQGRAGAGHPGACPPAPACNRSVDFLTSDQQILPLRMGTDVGADVGTLWLHVLPVGAGIGQGGGHEASGQPPAAELLVDPGVDHDHEAFPPFVRQVADHPSGMAQLVAVRRRDVHNVEFVHVRILPLSGGHSPARPREGTASTDTSCVIGSALSATRLPYHVDSGVALMPWAKTLSTIVQDTTPATA